MSKLVEHVDSLIHVIEDCNSSNEINKFEHINNVSSVSNATLGTTTNSELQSSDNQESSSFELMKPIVRTVTASFTSTNTTANDQDNNKNVPCPNMKQLLSLSSDHSGCYEDPMHANAIATAGSALLSLCRT